MGSMIETLKMPSRSRTAQKLLFTIGMLIVYRLGIRVPVPGIDQEAFTALIERFGQLGSFWTSFSGGAFKQVSIFAMGITPYVNSSIIMQLLTVAFPPWSVRQKER